MFQIGALFQALGFFVFFQEPVIRYNGPSSLVLDDSEEPLLYPSTRQDVPLVKQPLIKKTNLQAVSHCFLHSPGLDAAPHPPRGGCRIGVTPTVEVSVKLIGHLAQVKIDAESNPSLRVKEPVDLGVAVEHVCSPAGIVKPLFRLACHVSLRLLFAGTPRRASYPAKTAARRPPQKGPAPALPSFSPRR